MVIEVIEIGSTKNSTASQLFIDGSHKMFVIEDGLREVKIPGDTRISGGVYPLKPRYHGRFYEAYKTRYRHEFAIEICDIPDFSDVLLHIGNSIEDTRGCLLLNSGISISKSDGNYSGVGSVDAYLSFYNIVAPELKAGRPVILKIVRQYPFYKSVLTNEA